MYYRLADSANIGSIGTGQRAIIGSGVDVETAVTPPVGSVSGSGNDAKDDQSCDSNTGVEGCRGNIVVLDPPLVPVSADPEHEHKTGCTPRREVDRGGGRHHTGGVEDKRNVDILEPFDLGPLSGSKPERNGCKEADKEHPKHGLVN